jgi:Na+/H+ antiporter NhaD/arsenite permease-like protein
MKQAFVITLIIAVAVQTVVMVLLVRQAIAAHVAKDQSSTARPVVQGRDVLSAAAIFGGCMIITALAAGTFDQLTFASLLGSCAIFGFATAGLVSLARALRTRRKQDDRSPWTGLLYALPIATGVLAGLAGGI